MSGEKTTIVGSTVNVILVLALVVAGFAVYYDRDRKPGRTGVDKDVSEQIQVFVEMEPADRSNNTGHLIIRVEGVTVIEELLSRSPFDTSFLIPRGAEVIATIEQRHRGVIKCEIWSDGKPVGRRDRITDTGTAYCRHNLKRS